MAKDSLLNIILNIVKQGTGDKDASDGMSELQKQAGETTNALLGQVVGFTTLAGAALAAVEVLKQSIDAASELETTEARLGATIQSTGRSSEASTPQIQALAESMQGLFTRVDIETAANTLMRYMDIPTSQIPGDLALIENLAAGLGTSLPDAANTLGMALETGRVRGLGFSRELTNEISLLATHGDTAQMDAVIIDQLSAKYSGQYSAALETYAGKQAEVNTAQQDFKEEIGASFLPAGKALDSWWTGNIELMGAGLTNWRALGDIIAAGTVKMVSSKSAASLYQDALNQVKVSTSDTTDETWRMEDAWNQAGAVSKALTKNVHQTDAQIQALTKDVKSEYDFLNSAIQTTGDSEAKIGDIETQLAAARKQGYGDWSTKVQGLKQQLADAQAAEQKSMEQLVANWVYTQSVVTGKMDMGTFLEMEEKMGLITTQEEQIGEGWLNVVKTFANNPAYAVATMNLTYKVTGEAQAQQQGSSNPPPAPKTQHVIGMDPNTHMPIYGYAQGGQVPPNSILYNEDAGTRPEMFVAGGGYMLTKQDAQAALAGGSGTINLYVNGAGDPAAVAREVIRQLGATVNLQGARTRL